MDAGLDRASQHQLRVGSVLLQALQVQLHRVQQTLHGVLGCQLKAQITQRLRRSQGFQLLPEAGKTA